MVKTEPVFRLNLLACVAELDEPSGGEIRDHMAEPPYRYPKLRKERVYVHLPKLEDEGLIDIEESEPGYRNSYQITDAGREYLREQLTILERALQ